jgi:activator of HSP90 ATPase
MKTQLELKRTIPASSEEIYDAWLSSEGHTAMTGGKAMCSPEEGAVFSAWDGYISGRTVKLVPHDEIVQTWRTSDFKEEDGDSKLIVRLAPVDGGSELTLIHKEIPEGQPDYEQGWIDHYLNPMLEHFGK